MRWRIAAVLVAVAGACAGSGTYAWNKLEPESSRYARSTADEVLFVGRDRVLLSNGLGQVFESDSSAHSWREVTSGVFGLAVADSTQVWGCHGWPGIHEGPSATVWHSPDAGHTWARTDLSLPGGAGHTPEVQRRLPAIFVNEPADPPLLLMQDLQLVRPRVDSDFDSWSPVGTRVPADEWGGSWRGSGVQHGGVTYVATPGHIFMSVDNARTWSKQDVHRFFDAHIICSQKTCFALLSETGSAWSGVVTTPLGSNDWKPLGTLDLPPIRQALAEQSTTRGTVEAFGATSILLENDEVLVSGIVNAGGKAWGAVLAVSADGSLRSLPGSVADGLWGLARDGHGRLWAAGIGAFIYENSSWTRVWSGNASN